MTTNYCQSKISVQQLFIVIVVRRCGSWHSEQTNHVKRNSEIITTHANRNRPKLCKFLSEKKEIKQLASFVRVSFVD